MAQDLDLNARMKRMWRIKQDLDENVAMHKEDMDFFKEHLIEAFNYYVEGAKVWAEAFITHR